MITFVMSYDLTLDSNTNRHLPLIGVCFFSVFVLMLGATVSDCRIWQLCQLGAKPEYGKNICDENRSDRDETPPSTKTFNVFVDGVRDYFLYLQS